MSEITRIKFERGHPCLVVCGDKIRDGRIVDAIGGNVKVKFNWFTPAQWFPIKGQNVRVEFKLPE